MTDPQTNTGPFGIPPGGPWFVNTLTGTIQRQSNPVLAEGLVTSQMWTGFATQAEAKAFASKGPAGTVKAHAPAPLKGLAAVGDFAQRLTQASTWKRIGEVLIGAALLIVGIAKLAAGTTAGKAAVNLGTKAALL